MNNSNEDGSLKSDTMYRLPLKRLSQNTHSMWISRTFVAQQEIWIALWPQEAIEQDKFFNSMGALYNEKQLVAQDGHLAPSSSNVWDIFILNIFLNSYIFQGT